MSFFFLWPSTALAIACSIAKGGYKKKSLSKSGVMAAIIVGTLSFTANLKFGLILIAFFLSSSILTKTGATKKKKIEADFKEGIIVACVWLCLNGLEHSIRPNFDELSSALTAAYLAHYSCCCGDTWASEVGSLSSSPPRLVLPPFKIVKTGTNGGVSSLGLTASAAGGAFIGFVGGAVDLLTGLKGIVFWTLFCASLGLLGSLIDSVLGATLQLSLLDKTSGKVLSGSGIFPSHTTPLSVTEKDKNNSVEKITGQDVFDNHQVNLISSLLTSIVGGVAYYFFFV